MDFLRKLFKRKSSVEMTDVTKRFDLIGRVGQGSMSKVWRARDHASARMVALKVLDKKKTHAFESRFIGASKPTEGEVAVQLKHPHIVDTYEYGWTIDMEQFLVMEFVDGVSLSFLVDMQNERMQKGRLKFMIQLGEAIEYFHNENWIHRDICPRNVLVTNEGEIKFIDFGLVVPNTATFRQPGNRTGTALYMAPELIKRQRTDQRIDIFSYAATCFEMYSKRLPWDSSSGVSFDGLLQRINKPPVEIREVVSDIDSKVADAIMRGLARFPEDRWRSIGPMIECFREVQERIELRRKKRKRLLAKTKAAKTTKKRQQSTSEKRQDKQPATGTKISKKKQSASSVASDKPAVKPVSDEKKTQIVEDKKPVVEKKKTVVEDKKPVVEDKTPVVEDKTPIVEKSTKTTEPLPEDTTDTSQKTED